MGKRLASLRRQVGQVMIIGFDGVQFKGELQTTLRAFFPAGVIFFARNLTGIRQTWSMLGACHRLAETPLFLCVDMEGGTVDRLKTMLAPAPSVADVTLHRQPALYRRHGEIIGRECRALGFNVDFAPVLDLGFPASAKVLTSRTVPGDAAETLVYAREFLKGLASAKVLGCGKHFPGLGAASLDSHHALPIVDKSWQGLWAEDLVPYRVLHKQLPFIMVAHSAYPSVTGDACPASLSKKWITTVLRKKIGYRGLIVADDLEMGGAQAAGSVGEIAVATMAAGSDIFLICHNPQLVSESFESVLREAERSPRFAAKIAIAANRVFAFKKRRPALKAFPLLPAALAIRQLQRMIQDFNALVATEPLAKKKVVSPSAKAAGRTRPR